MYLKDHSPYPDSSLFVVNFRIQLELIYWATTPPIIIMLLICRTYIPSLIIEPTVVPATRFRYRIGGSIKVYIRVYNF